MMSEISRLPVEVHHSLSLCQQSPSSALRFIYLTVITAGLISLPLLLIHLTSCLSFLYLPLLTPPSLSSRPLLSGSEQHVVIRGHECVSAGSLSSLTRGGVAQDEGR